MKVSFVIVTRNRRDALLRTLERLHQNPDLRRLTWELIVIDNASEDDTAEAIVAHHRGVQVIRLSENEGVPARNHALPMVKGRYIAFLDDDSYPLPGAIPKALSYLARHRKTAAVVARVVLPDGSFEAPAIPAITLGGASVIRKSVLDQVGGFAPEFFRQAEEYDLSFRIWRAGYRIERFEDVLFGHDKVEQGRSSSLTRKMDLRNNLILIERYLPRALRRAYRHDWIQRYGALGLHEGFDNEINAALKEARVWAQREAAMGRQTLDPTTIETIFGFDAQARAVADWSRKNGIRSVAIADFSKNIYATFRACTQAELKMTGVLDNTPAFSGQSYRGLSIVDDAKGISGIDGIVLSNLNAAQIDRRLTALEQTSVPILRLWHPKVLDATNPSPANASADGAARNAGIDAAA